MAEQPAALALAGRHRLRAWEPIPWMLAIALYFVFPNHLGFGTELLITILFALSLDLVLGYAGIVTLGHAAFFGVGAYTVGMLAKHGIWNEPITGLILAAAVAAVVGLGSGVVLLRTHGLTLLMLTLCTMTLLEEAANLAHDYTGGFDGLDSLAIRPLLGGSSSIRSIRGRSISTSSPCCSSALPSYAPWCTRRSARVSRASARTCCGCMR